MARDEMVVRVSSSGSIFDSPEKRRLRDENRDAEVELVKAARALRAADLKRPDGYDGNRHELRIAALRYARSLDALNAAIDAR